MTDSDPLWQDRVYDFDGNPLVHDTLDPELQDVLDAAGESPDE